MRPIVVYDTNVLISGMIWGGVPYDCIALAQRNAVEAITCTEILDEFSEKLTTKFKASPLQAAEMVAELLNFHQSIKITNQLKSVTADPDDDKVIECAVETICPTTEKNSSKSTYPSKPSTKRLQKTRP